MPRFSIVIPTHRRVRQLEECLHALERVDYPREQFEVIVVSDGPDSAADAVIRKYAAGMPVRGFSQEQAGPALARNRGAGDAAGEFLLFLDDDCAPAPDWLREWQAHTVRSPESAAAGGTQNALSTNLCASASQLLLDFVHDYFNAGVAGRLPFLASNNLCVPAERFRRLGGFSASFPLAAAEDRDFSDRWHEAGWPTARAPLAIVFHAHHMTLAGFCRQHWNYGRGAFRLRQERRLREQPFRIEPLHRFYLELLCAPWKRESFARALPLCGLLVVAQAANAAGFFREGFGEAPGAQATMSRR